MSSFHNFQKKKNYYNNRNNIYTKEREKYKKSIDQKLALEIEEKRKREKNLDLSNNEIFPSLLQNSNNIKIEINNITDFNEIKLKILSDNSYNNSNQDKANNSENKWLILNDENINKYKKEKNDQKIIKEQEMDNISINTINHCYNKLSLQWNSYRDKINSLYGDTSPYISYKKDIEDLIFEENKIQEEIYGNLNYFSSDDEHNEYDNDDFYYFK